MDGNIKKMLTPVELLQDHMMENVAKPNHLNRVFRVKEGFFLGLLKHKGE